VLKELITIFLKIEKRNIGEELAVAEALVELNVKDTSVYNKFLQDVGQVFTIAISFRVLEC